MIYTILPYYEDFHTINNWSSIINIPCLKIIYIISFTDDKNVFFSIHLLKFGGGGAG